MTRLSARKTKAVFVTDATVRYRGKQRAIIVEALPETAIIRLTGSRTKYYITWAHIHDCAARIFAEQQRAEKKRARRAA